MRARAAGMAAATLVVAAVPAADAARKPLSYQGFTSQGHQIAFKRSSAGVFSMKIAIQARCLNDQGQNQGDYDFSLRAVDTVADAVKRGRFMVRLAGDKKTPDATIKGTINSRGVARGTIVAVGRVTDPSDIGTCRSGTVRWTAGP
ncbi:MAG TPA: hypothetical protein VH247_13195 [Thermoleophilaceae bacterium]|nr:hypothetical protein [Thermoleophilaceae bacterium]